MTYTIVQGEIITEPTFQRTVDVLQIPDHYMMTNVRLPRTLSQQYMPQRGSIVLVASEDAFKSYIIAVLREPLEFISREGIQGLRASSAADRNQLRPGEIFMESRGDPAAPFPGTGATFFMGNDGTITLHSGKRKEAIMIGGSDDDDDGEIIIQADNGFYESNINNLTLTRSVYRFDEDNNLTLGNILTDGGVTDLEIPISELTMDTLGNTTLRNTIFGTGTDNAALDLTAAGVATLKNNFGSFSISAAGEITLTNPLGTVTIAPSGNITVNGTTINMNNGGATDFVARLNDQTLIDASTDPTFLAFLAALDAFTALIFTTFNLHTHLYSPGPGGPTPTAPPIPLLVTPPPTSPPTITGKINAASSTVKAG